MRKNKVNAFSIVLYVLGALTGVYSLWALYSCVRYLIDNYMAGSLMISGLEFEVTTFFVTSAGQYFIYMIILIALGMIIQKQSNHNRLRAVEEEQDDKASDSADSSEDEVKSDNINYKELDELLQDN